MGLRRRVLLAALLVLALVPASIALAVKPGEWQDTKHHFALGVAANGKRITHLNRSCTAGEIVTKAFKGPHRLRIRAGGRFSYRGPAKLQRQGSPVDDVKMRVKGRFVTRKGRRRAV